jgi:hypothetical protein
MLRSYVERVDGVIIYAEIRVRVNEVVPIFPLESVPIIVTVYIVVEVTAQLTGINICLLVESIVAPVGRPEAV